MFTRYKTASKILAQSSLLAGCHNQVKLIYCNPTSGALLSALQNTANESAVHSLPQQRLYNKFSHTWRSCQIDQLAITRLMQNGALHAALPSRWFSSSKLKPKHVGCKLKVYSSFKERFKLTATGRVKYMPPGHRHKRSSKSMDQNRNLRKSSMLFSTYAKTMKKLGFRMTSY